MKSLNDLWYPYRWGLKARKKLIKFASTYGSYKIGKFWPRRVMSVFIASLLDENHQETYTNTIEYKFKNEL